MIRALEFAAQTGGKISAHNEKERAKESPYLFAYLVLNRPRAELYERINLRVDQMMNEGLLEETRRLYEAGLTPDRVSMQGLGYKQLLAYLMGECSLPEAVDRIKKETRHFAKRQITWFKRERDVSWINRDEYPDEDSMYAAIRQILYTKGLC